MTGILIALVLAIAIPLGTWFAVNPPDMCDGGIDAAEWGVIAKRPIPHRSITCEYTGMPVSGDLPVSVPTSLPPGDLAISTYETVECWQGPTFATHAACPKWKTVEKLRFVLEDGSFYEVPSGCLSDYHYFPGRVANAVCWPWEYGPPPTPTPAPPSWSFAENWIAYCEIGGGTVIKGDGFLRCDHGEGGQP